MEEQLEVQLQAASWSPDPPDFRDLTLSSDGAFKLLQFVNQCDQGQDAVDLRELMLTDLDFKFESKSTAHACCSLLEYYRQLCEGNTARLSRAFVHRVTLLLDRKPENCDPTIRSVFKCIKSTGIPPASLVRHLESLGKCPEDAPLCYRYKEDFSELQYLRIVGKGESIVMRVRSLVAAGIPCVFGMAVPSSFSNDPRIDIRRTFDRICGHTAGLIVGFDDNFLMSTRGAFLFQSALSAEWGDQGYGWLSYELFRQSMISDVWTAIQPTWLNQMAIDRRISLH